MSVRITVKTASGVEEFTSAWVEDYSFKVTEGALRLEMFPQQEVRTWAPGEWRSTHTRIVEDG